MVAALHAAGIKLIVDIVPNHTSDRHAWFQEALAAAPGSPARDRYIFRDGPARTATEPPSDWASMFGGPAWHRVAGRPVVPAPVRPEQPDLNWDNPEVREDFLTHPALLVRPRRRRVPRRRRPRAGQGPHASRSRRTPSSTGAVPQTASTRSGTATRCTRSTPSGAQVFNEYDPPRTAVAEAWVHAHPPRPLRQPRGARPGVQLRPAAGRLGRRAVPPDHRPTTSPTREASGASSTWVFSNHDVVRHPTRYGLPADDERASTTASLAAQRRRAAPALDRELGLRRARAATLLMLALPGSRVPLPGRGARPARGRRPPGRRRCRTRRSSAPQGVEKGRDGCRVPLPWTHDGPSFGFGSGSAAPAAAGLVRRRRRSQAAGRRRGLDARLLPPRARAAPRRCRPTRARPG